MKVRNNFNNFCFGAAVSSLWNIVLQVVLKLGRIMVIICYIDDIL